MIDRAFLANRKQEMIKLRESGMTYREIGHKYNLSHQRVHQIINEIKRYKVTPKVMPEVMLEVTPEEQIMKLKIELKQKEQDILCRESKILGWEAWKSKNYY